MIALDWTHLTLQALRKRIVAPAVPLLLQLFELLPKPSQVRRPQLFYPFFLRPLLLEATFALDEVCDPSLPFMKRGAIVLASEVFTISEVDRHLRSR